MGIPTATEERWTARGWAATALRLAIFLVPVAAGFLAGTAVARSLPPASHPLLVTAWWVAVIAASTLVATAVDRVARRLLPLAVLLQMTMLFPDKAPSRLRVARRMGNVAELRRRIADSNQRGDRDLAAISELILALAAALSQHDRRTRGHSERTRAYTDLLAEELGLSERDRDRLRWAALLHDVGKLEVPSEVLNKDGALEEHEWEHIRQHPVAGMRLIQPLAGWLGPWAKTVEHHHERWDGSGYPHGLSGTDIALGARIVSVADAYDVMTSGRSYQKAMSPHAARAEIARMAGTQFDPTVARALMNVSLGRLRWAAGPLSVLAELPFIGGLERLTRDTVSVLTTATVVASAAATGLLPGPLDLPVTPAPAVVAAGVASGQSAAEAPASLSPGDRGGGSTRDQGVPVEVSDTSLDQPGGTTTNPSTPASDPGTPPLTTAPPGTTPPDTSTPPGTTAPPTAAAPVARPDTATTPEDTAVTVAVLDNDSDADGDLDPSTLTIISSPSRGSAQVSGSGVRYLPSPNLWGDDSFGYRVCDLGGRCSNTTVTVTVTPVNDPPQVSALQAQVDAGSTGQWALSVSDPDNDPLHCSLSSPPLTGTASVAADCSRLTYSAPSASSGTVTLTVSVSDGTVEVPLPVSIEVLPAPAGTARDDSFTVSSGKPNLLHPTANDGGVDAKTLTVVSGPSHGTLEVLGNGNVMYRSERGFQGDDQFVYRVCTTAGVCSQATVRLTVG